MKPSIPPAPHRSDSESPAQILLEIADLHLSYGDRKVLKGIRLRVKAGEFCALLGRNGAGKSTLMRVLMRAEIPTQGQMSLKGLSWDEDSVEWPQRVAMVSEGLDVPLPMSVKAFYKKVSQYYPLWDEARFQEILRDLRFDDSKTFSSLSRGQKVQITLAAALASQPQLILLDEVTAVLDAHARHVLLRALREFTHRGGTVILATNIASEVHQFADHVAVLQDGQIAIHAAAEELSSVYCKLRQVPGGLPIPDRILDHPRTTPLTRNSDGSVSFLLEWEILKTLLAEGPPDAILDRRGVSIEDVFLYFTAHPEGVSELTTQDSQRGAA